MAQRVKRISGHSGKMVYFTDDEARYIARQHHWREKMRPYKCNADGYLHWHLTSLNRRQYKKINKMKRKRERYF